MSSSWPETPELEFSYVVEPCCKIRVAQGPIGADTVAALQFQVGRQETERRAEPMPRGPADLPQISAAKRIPAHLAGCSYRRSWPGSRRRGPWRTAPPAPARPIAPSAAERRRDQPGGRPRRRSPAPGAGQAPSHQRTGNAGAHDQHIDLLGQGIFSSDVGRRRCPAFRTATASAWRGITRRLATSMSCRSFVSRTIHPA